MGGILKRMPLATIITKIYNANDEQYDIGIKELYKHTLEATNLLNNAVILAERNPDAVRIRHLVKMMAGVEQIQRSLETTIHNVDDSKMVGKDKMLNMIVHGYTEFIAASGRANRLLENINRKKLKKSDTPPEFELTNAEPEDKEQVTPKDLGYSEYCTRLANIQFTYKNLRSYPKKYDVATLKEESSQLYDQIGETIKKLDEGQYNESAPDVYNTFVNLQHEVKLVLDDVKRITPVRF